MNLCTRETLAGGILEEMDPMDLHNLFGWDKLDLLSVVQGQATKLSTLTLPTYSSIQIATRVITAMSSLQGTK